MFYLWDDEWWRKRIHYGCTMIINDRSIKFLINFIGLPRLRNGSCLKYERLKIFNWFENHVSHSLNEWILAVEGYLLSEKKYWKIILNSGYFLAGLVSEQARLRLKAQKLGIFRRIQIRAWPTFKSPNFQNPWAGNPNFLNKNPSLSFGHQMFHFFKNSY